MDFILPLLVGLAIGWFASLAMGTDTQLGIVRDMLVGATGAVALALMLGEGSIFDALISAGLGALLAVGILSMICRLLPDRRAPAGG